MRRVKDLNVGIADGTVAPGTTRLTDLGASWQTSIGEELAGRLITSVRATGTHQSAVGGIQSVAYALFLGPDSLDVADVAPLTASDNYSWWYRRHLIHRGMSHTTGGGSPATEFDEKIFRFSTRGTRRMPANFGHTLWFAEETLTQNQAMAWTFDIRTAE